MKRAFLNLFRKGESNLIKILCLGIGLAIGLIMLAEVIFEQSYDNFIPRLEDTYQINNLYKLSSDKHSNNSSHTPGAIAPGIKTYCPEVEAATRFTYLNYSMNFLTEEQFEIQGNGFLCDSAFFDVFPRPILIGEDPHTGLEKANNAYISSEMMKKLGKQIIGKKLIWKEFPDFQLNIVGAFEAFPENTHLPKMDVVIALPTIGQVRWDGRNNWLGNDQYLGYLRLQPGTDPKSLDAGIQHMMDVHHLTEALQKSGTEIKFTLQPVSSLFSSSDYNRIMNLTFLAFGLIMLGVAVLNYILLVVSSLVNRAKSIATLRCYGAGNKQIYYMILNESVLHCSISLILAILIIFSLQDFLQAQIGHSLQSLFPPSTLLLYLGIVIVITLLCGIMPGYLYCHIPVTCAYRRYTETKRHWKLGLLFVQFLLTSLFVCLLAVIGLQYHTLTHYHTGFEYRHILYVSLPGTTSTEQQRCVEELKKLPNVVGVTWGYQELFISCSGNNVYLPGKDMELFNIADMYLTGPDYHRVLDIPVIEGSVFTAQHSLSQEIMISRSFVEKMRKLNIWDQSSPIGKSVCITEHKGELTVRGVYEDIHLGSQIAEYYDNRPTVMFYSPVPQHQLLYIRLAEMNSDRIQEIQDLVTRSMPSQDKKVNSLHMEINGLYNGVLHVRNSILFAGLCILIIALIGLIAYIKDEVSRRRSEIAIRLIHGANIRNIQFIFLADLLKTALPAILTGGLAAYLISQKLLTLFTVKINLSWWIFGGCIVMILLVIFLLTYYLIQKAAQANPTSNLRSE